MVVLSQFYRGLHLELLRGLSLLLQLCQNGRSLISARGTELCRLYSSVPLALLVIISTYFSPNVYTDTMRSFIIITVLSALAACYGAAVVPSEEEMVIVVYDENFPNGTI
ncbi:hypothetical protein SFRURICE_017449, partial [Spodoptera frugiperda]